MILHQVKMSFTITLFVSLTIAKLTAKPNECYAMIWLDHTVLTVQRERERERERESECGRGSIISVVEMRGMSRTNRNSD